MTTQQKRATIKAPAKGVPLRGPSGKLYGTLDLETLTIEFKRGGQAAERIDLKPLMKTK